MLEPSTISAGLIRLRACPRLASKQIEAEAELFRSNLRRTPQNSARTFWRDLGVSEIPVSYPLSLELICDFHRIRLLFVSALQLALPGAVEAFAKITEINGIEPAIYLDEADREFILYRPEPNNRLTRFFIAAQVGHLILHVRKQRRAASKGYFVSPNIGEECRKQAAAFARALLMPRIPLEAALGGSKKADSEKRRDAELIGKLSQKFGSPQWAVRARLNELSLDSVMAGEIASASPA